MYRRTTAPLPVATSANACSNFSSAWNNRLFHDRTGICVALTVLQIAGIGLSRRTHDDLKRHSPCGLGLAPGKLLLRRPLVNRNASLAADAGARSYWPTFTEWTPPSRPAVWWA